jgi:putative hydrolase of the HAD superfamily
MSIAFDGVAFDLDGTLYPNYRLYRLLLPFIFKEHRLLRALGAARKRLRAGAVHAGSDFYDTQADIMGELLNTDRETAKEKTERLIYRGWEPLFTRVRLYPQVAECLTRLRHAGLKLGLLSDFPPEKKIAALGLRGLWDAVVCSETVGALKPHPAPFLELARALDAPPEKLLYVGNSVEYDIIGAKKSGMRAALIMPLFKPFQKNRRNNADFIFSRYQKLCDYVLGRKEQWNPCLQ